MILLRRVVGDSMLPTLKAGRILLAIRTKRVKPGDIVVFRHNGLEKTKRVKYVKNDKVYVTGDNKSASTDSRDFGWLSRKDVRAKVIWPA